MSSDVPVGVAAGDENVVPVQGRGRSGRVGDVRVPGRFPRRRPAGAQCRDHAEQTAMGTVVLRVRFMSPPYRRLLLFDASW